MDIYTESKVKIWRAFKKSNRKNVGFNEIGRVPTPDDNTLSLVKSDDYLEDVRASDSFDPLGTFRAIHSSCALTVNCFAPFRKRIKDLKLPVGNGFKCLKFEAKCSTDLPGFSPNIDVLIRGETSIVGVESKFTEIIQTRDKEPTFSPKYEKFDRHDYYEEMQKIKNNPFEYHVLDATQLIKDAYGLTNSFPDRNIILLYVYWEPRNFDTMSPLIRREFKNHRNEISKFAESVKGGNPKFVPIRYSDLWDYWRESADSWLVGHLNELDTRYNIDL